MPQLYPAKPLAKGTTEFGAGVSGDLPLGPTRRQLRKVTHAVGPSADPAAAAEQEARAVEAAILETALAPGIAPWLAARGGIGWNSEAQLSTSGRRLRLGVRHGIELPNEIWASAGFGAASLHQRTSNSDDGSENREDAPYLHGAGGFGLDIPVVIGWQSRGQIIALWAGIVVGLDQLSARLEPSRADVAIVRRYGAGLLGLSAGLEPIRVRAELAANYSSGRAEVRGLGGGPDPRPVALRGFSLAPAAAIAFEF